VKDLFDEARAFKEKHYASNNQKRDFARMYVICARDSAAQPIYVGI
jgi:hypothetical protein